MGPKKQMMPLFKAIQPTQSARQNDSCQPHHGVSSQQQVQGRSFNLQTYRESTGNAAGGMKMASNDSQSQGQGGRIRNNSVSEVPGGAKRKAAAQGGREVAVVPDQDAWHGSDDDEAEDFSKHGFGVNKKPKMSHSGAAPGSSMGGAGTKGMKSKVREGQTGGALGRTDIENLTPLAANLVVAGMVVSIRDANSFISKKSGTETFVRHFIIKDDSGTIDCVLWADIGDKYIELLQLGNLIELIGPEVRSKQENEKFKSARTTSPYELHVSPSRGGGVLQYDGEEGFREPIIKQGWMPLNDLIQMGDQLIDAEVSILACIKKINPVQEIITKQDKRLMKRELVLFDQTNAVLEVTLWGDAANCLGLFAAVQTIVLISNVKVTSFRGNIQGSLGFSSLIDVNPDVLEGALLYDYAQTVAVDDDDFGRKSKSHFDESKITEQLSIKELETRIMGLKKGEGLSCFVMATLSRFDIDSDCQSREVVIATCNQCKARFSPESTCSCDPESELPGYLSPTVSVQYDLVVSFIDDSGSFTSKVFPDVALPLMTMTADEFLMTEMEQRTRLKATKLFESFKVFIKVDWTDGRDQLGNSGNSRIPRLTILGCHPIKKQ